MANLKMKHELTEVLTKDYLTSEQIWELVGNPKFKIYFKTILDVREGDFEKVENTKKRAILLENIKTLNTYYKLGIINKILNTEVFQYNPLSAFEFTGHNQWEVKKLTQLSPRFLLRKPI